MTCMMERKRQKWLWLIGIFFAGIWISIFLGGGYEKKADSSAPSPVIKKGNYYAFHKADLKKFLVYLSIGNLHEMKKMTSADIIPVQDSDLKIKILDRSQSPYLKVQWGVGEWGPEMWTMSQWVREVK